MIGPAIRIVKGGAKSAQLRYLLPHLEKRLSTPLLERFSGAERFDIAAAIAEIQFLEAVKACPDAEAVAAKKFISNLKEEFQMAKEELKDREATMADIAALSIALKELAVSLDKHVHEAWRVAGDHQTEAEKRNTEYLDRLQAWTQDQIQTASSRMEKQLTDHEEKFQSIVGAFKDFGEKMLNEVVSESRRKEQGMVAALAGLQESSASELTKLKEQHRNEISLAQAERQRLVGESEQVTVIVQAANRQMEAVGSEFSKTISTLRTLCFLAVGAGAVSTVVLIVGVLRMLG